MGSKLCKTLIKAVVEAIKVVLVEEGLTGLTGGSRENSFSEMGLVYSIYFRSKENIQQSLWQ